MSLLGPSKGLLVVVLGVCPAVALGRPCMSLLGPSKAGRSLQPMPWPRWSVVVVALVAVVALVVALVLRKGLPVWGLSPGWTYPLLP